MTAGPKVYAPDGNAPPATDGKTDFAARTAKIYQAAKERHEAHPSDNDAAWKFARACYDWADYAASNSKRAAIAEEGIAACKEVLSRDPNSVPGHYYLGMDLGQLAQTKTLGALRIVSQMEKEFKAALALDENFDLGGPDRNLGLLYRDAPGWPASIGNNSKARAHLKRALQLAPDYPENFINLIEAELEWGENKAAAAELEKLDALWPAAQAKYSGEEWASSWVDWQTRRDAARKQLNDAPRARSPRGNRSN